jgi:putative ABC transport system permease protein
MYKTYFKQAVEMLKQNKFFSLISILGTALAVMMIMSIIVTDSIKNINLAPERNRDRTLYLTYQTVKDSSQRGVSTHRGWLTDDIIKNYVSHLKTPEVIAAYGVLYSTVGLEHHTETAHTRVICTEPSYWKIYSFKFIEGKPFNEEEFSSGMRHAIISEKMSKQFFQNENAMGKTILLNSHPYRITGIVQNVSPIFTKAFSDVWILYSSRPGSERGGDGYQVSLLSKSKHDFAAIRDEIRLLERRYNENEIDKTLTFGAAKTHRIFSMNADGYSEEQLNESAKVETRKVWFVLIVILLIPAVNLSGLNLSRIKKRTAEIGVRKAFGAKKHIILIQILWENLITSFIGGIIGLILSVGAVLELRNWLLKIPDDGTLPFNAVISAPVLVAVFLVCVLINILSAAIPACRASRMIIARSITNNDQTP